MTGLSHDEVALRKLVDAYGIAVDAYDADAIAALFVADGALLVYEAGSDNLAHSYRGAEIERLAADLRQAGYAQMFHFVGNVVLDVDEDHASGTTYCVASHLRNSDAGQQVMSMPVVYSDRFVRTDAGWRFEERVSTVLWRERRPIDQRPPRPSAVEVAHERS